MIGEAQEPETRPQTVITDAEVAMLNAARDALKAVGYRIFSEHDLRDTYKAGVLLEATVVAADAAFRVLNVAHTYCGAQLSNDDLHNLKQDA